MVLLQVVDMLNDLYTLFDNTIRFIAGCRYAK